MRRGTPGSRPTCRLSCFSSAWGEQANGLGDEDFQVEVDVFEAQLAGADAGIVENVVDDCHQRIAGAGDGIQVELLAAIQRRFAQQLQHAEHAVERSTDLMAHLGEEAALGLVLAGGPLGSLAGAVALFLEQVDTVGKSDGQGDQLEGDAGFHHGRPV